MNSTTRLVQYWRGAPDADIRRLVEAARRSVEAFAAATSASGSLLQSWIRGEDVVALDHFPADDLVDPKTGSQAYYHAHRDDGHGHGHLHLFYHATASGRRRYFRSGPSRWRRSAPTHLFGVYLDARGLPVGLFTVNQWVTDGFWFDAPGTMSLVDRFDLGNVEGHEAACRRMTDFVRLYRPLVEHLLLRRDRYLARRPDLSLALQDHRLEVLSAVSIDWGRDLDAIEAEARRRRVP